MTSFARLLLPLCAAAVLAACGSAPHREVSDEEATAIIKRVNRGPVFPVDPQPILEQEIAKLKYRGGGCVFSPGNGERGAMALAMKEAGYMKFDGTIVRFAVDSGSTALPDGARTRYVGTSHLFRLRLTAEGRGHLVVEDGSKRPVFEQDGKVWCDPDPAAATPATPSASGSS